jgi:zinc transport system substrate-binding protein
MKLHRIFTILTLMAALGLAACTPAPAANTGKLVITVSILPEKYFVERIGGDRVTVNVMVGPGDSPHTYEPKPAQMAALSQSALYFPIGVEFEAAWLKRITDANPNLKIVDLSSGIEKLPMAEHTPHEGEPHSADETLDPHVWTSPRLVKGMAHTIYSELAVLDPANNTEYKSNLDAFLAEIDALEAELTAQLKGLAGRKFMVFHPAWAYLARDYGLQELAIEIGGTEPSASELAALIAEAKAEGIHTVFAQKEFSTRISEYIAREIGGQVVVVSPLDEDWAGNLRKVAQAVAASFN